MINLSESINTAKFYYFLYQNGETVQMLPVKTAFDFLDDEPDIYTEESK